MSEPTTDEAAAAWGDHVGLSVADLVAEARFYVDALGFEEEEAFDLPFEGIKAIMLRHPSGFRIELFGHPRSGLGPRASGPIEAHATQGFNHFAMALADADAVSSLYERAVAAGARRVKDPQSSPLGSTFAFLADPEGHLFELISREL